jgi:hypothetical protein
MFTVLMIGMGVMVALGVPLCVWISYWIRRPTKKEELYVRIDEARRRFDRLSHQVERSQKKTDTRRNRVPASPPQTEGPR